MPFADGRGRVATVRCAAYDTDRVRAAVREVLAAFGGMSAFVRPGERVALKPNLLLAATPDKGITTHPAVVEAVALEVRAAGATPFVVESPGAGIPYSERSLEKVYRITGLREMADRIDLPLSTDTRVVVVSHPDGLLVKRAEVLAPLVEADAVLSLCKLKTHFFMTFTGGVKNMFGAVPGFAKPGYHAKLADSERFGDMLLDVAAMIRPRLTLMDAILALEGDGPGTAGRPREVGALLASRDPVALDVVACGIAGIAPLGVPTLAQALRRGWWDGLPESVSVTGPSVAELHVPDFVRAKRAEDAAGLGIARHLQGLIRPLANDAFNPRPRPKPDRCTACRTCERACPVGAITIRDRLARVDDHTCIRCYCCHELCPESAIDLELRTLGRALRKVGVR